MFRPVTFTLHCSFQRPEIPPEELALCRASLLKYKVDGIGVLLPSMSALSPAASSYGGAELLDVRGPLRMGREREIT